MVLQDIDAEVLHTFVSASSKLFKRNYDATEVPRRESVNRELPANSFPSPRKTGLTQLSEDAAPEILSSISSRDAFSCPVDASPSNYLEGRPSLSLPHPYTTDAKGKPWAGATVLDYPLGSHIGAPLGRDEDERLDVLRSYQILDTEPDDSIFNSYTQKVAERMDTEICLISLVDKDRQWFKSRYGLPVAETTRDLAFCGWAILPEAEKGANIFVVPDATKDRRFAGSPLVQGNPNIRFYAGVQLVSSSMHRVGTICAISSRPRPGPLSENDVEFLRSVSEQVMREMELRRQTCLYIPRNLRVTKALQKISHNLRTPLFAISGNLELLQQTEMSEEQVELMENINFGVTELLNTVSSLVFDHRSASTSNSGASTPAFQNGPASSPKTASPCQGRDMFDFVSAAAAKGVSRAPRFFIGLSPIPEPPSTPLPEDHTPVAAPFVPITKTLVDLNVLVVDDVPMNVKILVRMLDKLGIKKITSRENGREAVDAVEADPAIDIVFCDLQMPVMGGTEAASIISKKKRHPLLVAVTADTTEGVKVRCSSAGFSFYLSKPFSVDDVEEILRSCIRAS